MDYLMNAGWSGCVIYGKEGWPDCIYDTNFFLSL
jgi:hypothetical protein